MKHGMKKLAWLAGLALAAGAAQAEVIVLDFEGIVTDDTGYYTSINDFYDGNGGPDYGITFDPNALACIDYDAGHPSGTGCNQANEPSADSVMFFLEGESALMNVLNGFDTGFSFFYSSSATAFVQVWSGLNGTGDLLAQLDLSANYNLDCTGDPSGSYCHWDAIGVAFEGTAYSIDFGGSANFVGFDDVTLGSANPGGDPVPAPAPLALLGLGLVALYRRKLQA